MGSTSTQGHTHSAHCPTPSVGVLLTLCPGCVAQVYYAGLHQNSLVSGSTFLSVTANLDGYYARTSVKSVANLYWICPLGWWMPLTGAFSVAFTGCYYKCPRGFYGNTTDLTSATGDTGCTPCTVGSTQGHTRTARTAHTVHLPSLHC